MKTDLQLKRLIEQITVNLFLGEDYYIIYCRYYFFNDKVSRDEPVLFHKEHIFGVQLLETDILIERMPAYSQTKGAFTVRIPYDQIHKVTTVDPNSSPSLETVLFIKNNILGLL